ncbi:MAG: hypothetical protein AAGB11_18930 [Pseudomonadota bacterium]
MPTATLAKEGVKKLFDISRKKAVQALFDTLLQKALEKEAGAIAGEALKQNVHGQSRKTLLHARYTALRKKFDQEAGKPITGLAFASIAGTVVSEVNAYPFIDQLDVMDILSASLDEIDLVVDRNYQNYQSAVSNAPAFPSLNRNLGDVGEAVNKGINKVMEAGDTINQMVGIPESWAKAYDWTPEIEALRKSLRGMLQKAEDKRLAAIKTQEARKALRRDIINRLKQQVSALRTQSAAFIKARKEHFKEEGRDARSARELSSLEAKLTSLERSQVQLAKRGSTIYKRKIYTTDQRYQLVLEHNRIRAEIKNLKESAAAKAAAKEPQFDSAEHALMVQLNRVRELDYQLHEVEEDLGIMQRTKAAPQRTSARGEDVPWRCPAGFLKLRNDAYPFDRVVWAD